MNDTHFQRSLEEFIRLFDTGISSVQLDEFDFETDETIFPEMRKDVEDFLADNSDHDLVMGTPFGHHYLFRNGDDGTISAFKLMTGHPILGEAKPAYFDLTDESDGTRRLFDIIPALMELLNTERVFVIDELDRSLHPHLSYKILDLFLSESAERASQLIVTTHESSLLNLDLLRRDEIWFVEKSPDGMSNMYSLEEFAPRYDKDIRKGYLLGRFGAIPFVGGAPKFRCI